MRVSAKFTGDRTGKKQPIARIEKLVARTEWAEATVDGNWTRLATEDGFRVELGHCWEIVCS